MNAKQIKQLAGMVMVAGIMLVIFRLSAQPGTESRVLSNQFIQGFTKVVERLPFLPKAWRAEFLARPSHYVRKAAHLSIYALLGSVTLVGLWQTSLKKSTAFFVALFVCVLYAISDEWHQYYVAERGAQLRDVMIDTVGVLLGCGMVQVIRKLYCRK